MPQPCGVRASGRASVRLTTHGQPGPARTAVVTGLSPHDNVLYTQPMTLEERTEVASACALRLDLSIPMLIDDLDDSTDRQYYALPDRLYLIGRDGRIVYRGLPGPFGFIVAELEKAIEGYLAEAGRASARVSRSARHPGR